MFSQIQGITKETYPGFVNGYSCFVVLFGHTVPEADSPGSSGTRQEVTFTKPGKLSLVIPCTLLIVSVIQTSSTKYICEHPMWEVEVNCSVLVLLSTSDVYLLELRKLTSIENMEAFHIKLNLGVFLLTILADMSYGQMRPQFLSKHRKSIESYTMTGNGKRIDDYQCDVLHDDPQGYSVKGGAQFVMDIEKLDHFDISSNIGSSHCLLVSVEVNNSESLAAVLKFGWAVVQHKRVALVMKMVSNLTLHEARNITKLPFLVAAELKGGMEQFLCPAVGERDPHLQNSMCGDDYTSYEDKEIRVSIIGVPPYLYGD